VTSRVTARGGCVVILDDSKHSLFSHKVFVVWSLCACPRTMSLCACPRTMPLCRASLSHSDSFASVNVLRCSMVCLFSGSMSRCIRELINSLALSLSFWNNRLWARRAPKILPWINKPRSHSPLNSLESFLFCLTQIITNGVQISLCIYKLLTLLK